jgi:hypothetical protein
MRTQREWTLGAHRLRFEPPDILWVEYQGEVSLGDAIRLVDFYRELSTSGPFFLVVDLGEVPPVDREVQRYFSEHADPAWILSNIVVGARLVNKAVAKGIFLAMHLTGRSDESVTSKVRFVSSQEEASRLMARLRARRGDEVA